MRGLCAGRRHQSRIYQFQNLTMGIERQLNAWKKILIQYFLIISEYLYMCNGVHVLMTLN